MRNAMSDEPWLRKLMDRGESTRVTLPPGALEAADLRAGDKVTITVADSSIHITKGKVVVDE